MLQAVIHADGEVTDRLLRSQKLNARFAGANARFARVNACFARAQNSARNAKFKQATPRRKHIHHGHAISFFSPWLLCLPKTLSRGLWLQAHFVRLTTSGLL